MERESMGDGQKDNFTLSLIQYDGVVVFVYPSINPLPVLPCDRLRDLSYQSSMLQSFVALWIKGGKGIENVSCNCLQ